VATLAGVLDRLWRPGPRLSSSTTTLDLLAAADHLMDMGPGGGLILAVGTPQDAAVTRAA
jgi:excinuclease UvrABC ATPase subunit